jgi:predicted MPP superfamily phosphohydrolase
MVLESVWVAIVGVLFFGTLFVLLFFSQRFWFRLAWRLSSRVHSRPVRLALRIAWMLALSLVLILVATWTLGMRGVLFPRSLYALIGMWLSSGLFAWLAVKMVRAVERLWARARLGLARLDGTESAPANPSRRYFFQTSAFVAGATPFVGALYGFAAERLRYQVERVEVPISSLPEMLDGLRIVQLSDIHIGAYMPREQVRRAVEMANELSADLAVVTGDFVTSAADPLEACVEELAELKAPLGVWGCNGNHEIYARAEARAAQLFRQIGARVLRQENAELVWRGVPLNLIGVDYQRTRPPVGNWPPMLAGVENLVRPDRFNILLSHNPNAFPRAAELGIELTLAGHTHGGQIQVEILDSRFSPARFMTEFVAGLYVRPRGPVTEFVTARSISRLDTSRGITGHSPVAALYVNRGLGTVGAPVRIGVPPEITLLTLRRSLP